MANVAIRDVVDGGGVNKDAQANSLPPNAFSELINVRATARRFERFGDTIEYQDEYTDYELQDGARALFDIILNGVEGHLLVTATDVYYDIGSGWINISPSYSTFVDADDWILEQYGDVLILTSLSNVPFVYTAGDAQMTEFTNWPGSSTKVGRIFGYKNFLIAVNVEINTTEQSGYYFWSDVVIDGDVENVEWANLTTNLAGANTLPDGSGPVREGGVLRDAAILYTDRTAWRLDITNQVAGSTPLVFNARRIFADDGILAARCFVEVAGLHYVIGLNRIYIHDGFNKQYPADNRVNRFFYGRLGNRAFAFVTHYPRPNEIVFSYAIKGFDQASEALVYNYRYNVWTRWIFSETAGVFRYLMVGPDFSDEIPSWADLLAQGVTWGDLKNTSWNQLFPNTRDRVPYGLNTTDNVIYVLDSDDENTQTPFTLTIERRDLDLDEVFGEAEPMIHIKRITPMISGRGTVTFEVGGRNSIAEPVVYGAPVTFTIGTDYKVDIRQTWRFLAIRMTQTSAQGQMSFTGMDLNVKKASRR